MPLFPLDAIRNAPMDHHIELILEDVREEIATFPFGESDEMGNVQDMLDVYDMARPRFNVIASLLHAMPGGSGVDISTGLGFLPVILTRFGLRLVATEDDTTVSRFAAEHGIEV